MNLVVDDTNKRLRDLQVARDALAGRAETTAQQLAEVQKRAEKQISEYETLLSETKLQLEATEIKVRLRSPFVSVHSLGHNVTHQLCRTHP